MMARRTEEFQDSSARKPIPISKGFADGEAAGTLLPRYSATQLPITR